MKRKLSVLLLFSLVLSCLTACLPTTDTGTAGGGGTPASGTPTLSEKITEPAVHDTVKPAAYVQYATLSEKEKEAYDRLREGALTGVGHVDVSDLEIPRERATDITKKFLADHPQLFYLSRTIGYLYNPETNVVGTYQLLYTDGVTEDRYDGDTLTQKANRETIDGQIRQFNEKIRQIVSSVPASLSAAEKAKFLHDYIVQHTVYDTEAAEHDPAITPMPRAYDAFGTLLSGKAICEGYTKLYQYLCYCVGINGTQIVGTADGTPHTWNALLLENAWYLTDVTWDDPQGNSQGISVYDYYNVTSAEMNQTHVPDSSALLVPEATEDLLSFRRVYGVEVDSLGHLINYKTALDRLAAKQETHLYLYVKNVKGEISDFLGENIFAEDSPVAVYIKELGYDLSFSNAFVISGNYVYVSLK